MNERQQGVALCQHQQAGPIDVLTNELVERVSVWPVQRCSRTADEQPDLEVACALQWSTHRVRYMTP